MNRYIEDLISRYPALTGCRDDIERAFRMMAESIEGNGKLLIAGNGGSCADSNHIVGELMKSFCSRRKIEQGVADSLVRLDPVLGKELSSCLEGTIRAISLMGQDALTSAFSNDKDPSVCVAQQVYGYGDEGDVYLGISTSGNSRNIVLGALTAKAKGLKVIVLTGRNPCRLDSLADVIIKVPETETYRIQEYHLPIYHALCLALEGYFFQE